MNINSADFLLCSALHIERIFCITIIYFKTVKTNSIDLSLQLKETKTSIILKMKLIIIIYNNYFSSSLSTSINVI